MVLAFATIVPIFSDFALGAALIQRPEITEADRSTVFWTNVVTGVMLTLAGIVSAQPLAHFFHQPAVQPLFIAFSFTFLIASLSATQLALLTRAMDFRSLELRVMTATVCGAVVGVSAAVAGLGAWALIAQQITLASVGTLLLWFFSAWRPRATFSLHSLRDLGSYSGKVFSAHVLLQVTPNANNFVIGRYLGPAALGSFTVAYNVMLVPFYRIAAPIQEVLFPAFSRLQDSPQQIGQMWIRVNRVVAAVAVPALLGVVVTAPDLVAVVLGARWHSSVAVIRVLACVGIVQALQRLNLSILQARARSRALLGFAAAGFVVTIVAVVVGLPWGIMGVALAYAVATVVLQTLFMAMTARTLGMSIVAVARPLFGVIEAAVVMAIVVLIERQLLISAGVVAGLRLAMCVLGGAALFAGLCYLRAPELVVEVKGFRGSRPAEATSLTP
jgi:O-antigen/teichoic acid export membrane protein